MPGVCSAVCQLAVFGGAGAVVKYHYTYKTMRNGLQQNADAIQSFSTDVHREIYDVAVVGGGIVGVATARELRKQFPKKRIVLLEKEADVAQHQSSHNSGVIHAGMYYPPGSMMSRLCPRGHDLTIEYCRRNKLPLDMVGKLIVAVDEQEAPAVETLYEWGTANGVKGLEVLRSQEEIAKLEPNVKGIVALHSPNTGVTDFAAITRHMHKELTSAKSGNFTTLFNFNVQAFSTLRLSANDLPAVKGTQNLVMIRGRENAQVGPQKVIIARNVITCCGLSNDLMAKETGAVLWNSGSHRVAQTFSFRGRYYQLKPHARDLVKRNIYPVPHMDRAMDVGIHFTPTVDERRGHQMIIGPGNAMATARYGYNAFQMDPDYFLGVVTSSCAWKCLSSNVRAFFETKYTDMSRSYFLSIAQKIVPRVTDNDIEDSFCGVMGLAVNPDGTFESDLAMELARPPALQWVRLSKDKTFQFSGEVNETQSDVQKESPLVLNVRNAPSPAATSAMSIAEEVVATARRGFQW